MHQLNYHQSLALQSYCRELLEPFSTPLNREDPCMRNQIEELLFIQSSITIDYKFQEEKHQTPPQSLMSTLSHTKSRKKCIIPCKSTPNNLILNISQIKVHYTQHSKKGQNDPKDRKTITETSEKLTEKQKLSFQMGDQTGREISLKREYSVKSIQQYIFSSIGKEQRKKYVYNIYKGAIYSLQKLKTLPLQYVQSKQIYLNQATQSNKKFLLLDLDQTLIYTQKDAKTTSNQNKVTYKFLYRPHLFTFLEKMSNHYEVYVFTAAHKSYAEAVVKKLNRFKVYIKDVLYRDHCFETKKGILIKDLRIIKNRELQDLVIVDNLVQSFGSQLDNGVPLLEFNGNPHDEELLKIIPFLEQLSQAEDVRSILQEKFRLKQINQLDKKEVRNYFLE